MIALLGLLFIVGGFILSGLPITLESVFAALFFTIGGGLIVLDETWKS